MISGFSRKWRVPALGVLMIAIWVGPIKHANAAESGQEIFETYCAACHTIGQGRSIGPDLAGVTTRREESWLKRQIKEPDALIAENDPIATQLLQEADNIEMPPLELSDEQVAAVIEFLKSAEQQANVAFGPPSQFLPTVLISLAMLIGLTLVSLIVGRKKVDVR